jgi:bifunctional non-homologous end joining protein LigD
LSTPRERAPWGTALFRPSPFVVQRHRTGDDDHFDVRLQIGPGKVVSWTVRKGPSMDPRIPRLATRLPDALSLRQLTFEGCHPGRSAGPSSAVIIWDRGTFQLARDPRRASVDVRDRLHLGHLSIELHGERLGGGFSLIRTSDRHSSWLLIKRYDENCDFRWDHAAQLDLPSVVTGRTIDELLGDEAQLSA